jgi:hypothetical protein
MDWNCDSSGRDTWDDETSENNYRTFSSLLILDLAKTMHSTSLPVSMKGECPLFGRQ